MRHAPATLLLCCPAALLPPCYRHAATTRRLLDRPASALLPPRDRPATTLLPPCYRHAIATRSPRGRRCAALVVPTAAWPSVLAATAALLCVTTLLLSRLLPRMLSKCGRLLRGGDRLRSGAPCDASPTSNERGLKAKRKTT